VPIHYRGKDYKTPHTCYEANRRWATVSYPTFLSRLKNNATVEEALRGRKKKTVQTRLGAHTAEGVLYKNLVEIAKAYSLKPNTVYKRWARNCRGDDLVPARLRKNHVKPVKEKRPSKFEFRAGGVRYRSALAACKKHGVKYITYRKRRLGGWTLEESLETATAPDKRRGKTNDNARGAREPFRAVVDGVEYRSIAALAKSYSKSYPSVYFRIRRYNFTPEQAVKIEGLGKEVLVTGSKYKTITAAASAYGLELHLVLGRINYGLSLEQALGVEDYDTERTIEFEGKKYRNRKHLAEEKGIAYTTLQSRIASGLTLDEAIAAGERILNKGRYNDTIINRDPVLANKAAWLYFVIVSLPEGEYYKVGITERPVSDRLNNIRFTIIATLPGTVRSVYSVEQEILAMVGDKRLEKATAEAMDGYTEILDLTEEEANEVAALIIERRSRVKDAK
jgi:hypothetical protein